VEDTGEISLVPMQQSGNKARERSLVIVIFTDSTMESRLTMVGEFED